MSLKRVADAFWSSVADPEIADVFFEHAGWLNSNPTRTGPTDAVAARQYKGELTHTVAVARSVTTNPEILSKFAKDTRVSVRQALLENPSTPRATLVELSVWKFDRNDTDISACADRLELDELVEALRRLAGTEHGTRRVTSLDFDATTMVERCVEQPTMAVPLAAAGCISISARLAQAAHNGRLTGVTLSDVLSAHPEATERALLHILADRRLLSKELAGTWRKWRDDPSNRTYRHFGFDPTPFTSVEDGAADLLVDGDIAQLHAAIVNGADNDLLAGRFTSLRGEDLTHVVEAVTGRELSPAAERALAERVLALVDGGLGRFRVHHLLEALKHRLPDDTILGLVRGGGRSALHWWLENAASPNGPRPGLITELAARPKWRPGNGEQPINIGDEDWANMLIGAAVTDPGLADEVIAVHDEHIGRHLADRRVAAAMYPVLVRAFTGTEQRAAWETFLTLASDWSDSFTGLIGAVKGLLGIEEPVEAPNEPSGNTEQLTLL